MPFLVRHKVHISSKILPQIPNKSSLPCTILVYLLHFVKCRQKSIFSSRQPVFVISSVFRQKRNPLEPNNLFSLKVAAMLQSCKRRRHVVVVNVCLNHLSSAFKH